MGVKYVCKTCEWAGALACIVAVVAGEAASDAGQWVNVLLFFVACSRSAVSLVYTLEIHTDSC